jgi:hypothetical protein
LANAQTYTTVVNFQGGSNGDTPRGELILMRLLLNRLIYGNGLTSFASGSCEVEEGIDRTPLEEIDLDLIVHPSAWTDVSSGIAELVVPYDGNRSGRGPQWNFS